MSEYREIVLSGWGISHSHERREHFWTSKFSRNEFSSHCGRFTRYRPREEKHLGHCKDCERKEQRRAKLKEKRSA